MESWRDSLSEDAQDEMDELLSHSLEAAIEFLEKNKQFYPFAFALSADGDISLQAIDTGQEFNNSSSLIVELKTALQSIREDLRAVALVADVTVNQTASSAIQVQIEHREGIAITVTAPYSFRGLFKKAVELDELSAASTERFIWT